MLEFWPEENFKTSQQDVIRIDIEVEMMLGVDEFDVAAKRKASVGAYVQVVQPNSISRKNRMSDSQLAEYNSLVNDMIGRLDAHGFIGEETVIEQRGGQYSVYIEFPACNDTKTVEITFRVSNHKERGFNPNENRVMYSFNVNDSATYPDRQSLMNAVESACCEIDAYGYSPI